MKQYRSSGGTLVLDLDSDEYKRFLDQEVYATLGYSADEFVHRVRSGEVDWDDPDAFYIAGILHLGQNGHSESS